MFQPVGPLLWSQIFGVEHEIPCPLILLDNLVDCIQRYSVEFALSGACLG